MRTFILLHSLIIRNINFNFYHVTVNCEMLSCEFLSSKILHDMIYLVLRNDVYKETGIW